MFSISQRVQNIFNLRLLSTPFRICSLTHTYNASHIISMLQCQPECRDEQFNNKLPVIQCVSSHLLWVCTKLNSFVGASFKVTHRDWQKSVSCCVHEYLQCIQVGCTRFSFRFLCWQQVWIRIEPVSHTPTKNQINKMIYDRENAYDYSATHTSENRNSLIYSPNISHFQHISKFRSLVQSRFF